MTRRTDREELIDRLGHRRVHHHVRGEQPFHRGHRAVLPGRGHLPRHVRGLVGSLPGRRPRRAAHGCIGGRLAHSCGGHDLDSSTASSSCDSPPADRRSLTGGWCSSAPHVAGPATLRAGRRRDQGAAPPAVGRAHHRRAAGTHQAAQQGVMDGCSCSCRDGSDVGPQALTLYASPTRREEDERRTLGGLSMTDHLVDTRQAYSPP